MPEPGSYDYAVVRVVPDVERAEFLNAGVVLHARTQRFLGCRIGLDERRLTELAPGIDLVRIRDHLASFERICAGGPGSGSIGALDAPARFHWLVSPRSTAIQVSAVHAGLTDDPERELDRLFARLVAPRGAGADARRSGSGRRRPSDAGA